MKVLIDGTEYIPRIQFEDEPLEFNILIVQARKSFNETLDHAAYNIGISKSHLWSLEQGTTDPQLKTLQKILKYYGIPFEKIL